jgi:hypothetical protein
MSESETLALQFTCIFPIEPTARERALVAP